MAVKTNNSYGHIQIADDAIAVVAGDAALECYGVVDMVSRKFSDSLAELFKRQPLSRGVKIATNLDRIYIDLFVILKYGVSITAVADSIKSSVKYKVEKFTGMIVDTVNVHIIGIRL